MMTLPRFDRHPPDLPLSLEETPPEDLNELPTWPEIIDACDPLSYDEPFSVYRLAEPYQAYPAGSLVVTADSATYIQPVDTTGVRLTLTGQGEEPYFTASGVGCRQCPLWASRGLIVDGMGPFNPKVMIVAEAPGGDEDISGMPFVGKSGQMLRSYLSEVGFTADDYYMTNAVRCRPPENRKPTRAEIKACRHWLEEEVKRVKPQSVLLLGASARETFDTAWVGSDVTVWEHTHPASLFYGQSKTKTAKWVQGLREFAAEIGVGPGRAATHGARSAIAGWEHGAPELDADTLAVDTETRSLEDDYRSDIVSVQISDSRFAQFYIPVHHLAGTGGSLRLRQSQGRGEDSQGSPGSVQAEVREIPEGGRLASVPPAEMPELAAHHRREPSREHRPESRQGRAHREESVDDSARATGCYCTSDHRYLHLMAFQPDGQGVSTDQDAGEIGGESKHTSGSVGASEQGNDAAGDGRRASVQPAGVHQPPPHPADDPPGERPDVRAQHEAGYRLSPVGSPLCYGSLAETRRIIYHNSKYDAPRLGHSLWDLDSYEDTALIAYVLRYDRVGLKVLGPELTGIYMEPITSIIGSGKKQIEFDQALINDPARAVAYALKDAVVTARMFPGLYRQLCESPVLLKYYKEIEKPVVPVVWDMEQNGALVDNTALGKLALELHEQMEIQKALAQMWAETDELNPNSGRAVAQAVRELGGKLTDRTKTGETCTDKTALLRCCGVERPEDLPENAGALPNFVRAVLGYKQYGKLLSTYVPALRRQDDEGRVHTNFNQMVTDTSRFSSSDPNLQNIPSRTKIGKRFRECFVAPPGKVIVKADFSQLELRIYAHFTKEPILLEAYTGDEKDVHLLFAQQWGVVRAIAKNGVFGLVYGVEARKLAATLGIPQDRTQKFLEDMRREMPSIAGGWQEHISHILDQYGYVETLYGWRNYYPEHRSPIKSARKAALREAANLPIQGTAGGILKRLLVAYDTWRHETGACDSLPILMVHDEIVFEVPAKYAVEFGASLAKLAPQINPLSVNLRLSVEIGPNWGKTVELEKYAHAVY